MKNEKQDLLLRICLNFILKKYYQIRIPTVIAHLDPQSKTMKYEENLAYFAKPLCSLRFKIYRNVRKEKRKEHKRKYQIAGKMRNDSQNNFINN